LSEHLVNWYWPVVLFHWSRLPVLLSFKQVSKVGGGAVTAVKTVEALLVVSGSVPAWLIIAVFVIVAPPRMLGVRCNTNVKLNEDPEGIELGFVQTMVPAPPGGGAEQDQPVSGVAEMNVVPDGNTSDSWLGATEFWVPKLDTVIVYVMFSPAVTLDGACLVTLKSAFCARAVEAKPTNNTAKNAASNRVRR